MKETCSKGVVPFSYLEHSCSLGIADIDIRIAIYSRTILSKEKRCEEINLTRSTNPRDKARPKHCEFHTLICPNGFLTSFANRVTLKIQMKMVPSVLREDLNV